MEGHTDSKGSEAYNINLSLKRAQTVAEYLKSKHVMPSQLKVIGKGEADSVAINTNVDGTDNLEGRKFNRRVVIIPAEKGVGLMVIHRSVVPNDLRVKKD